MPRKGSIASDVEDYLRGRRAPASIDELVDGLNGVRRFPVLRHSLRSALYQHLDRRGDRVFVRVGRGRYALRGGDGGAGGR